ncbi:MAG: coproporphyrinogen III oxidase [Gammaproteobacteria bacterium]|nr:MAG: coproporphyrinogen III oxidase [Gammaproteobacteria bacterium]
MLRSLVDRRPVAAATCRRRLGPASWTLACWLLATSLAVASSHDRTRPQLPAAEQDRLTQRFERFVARMDERQLGRVMQLNGNTEREDRFVANEYSDYDLRVTRGPVIEKAGRMLTWGKQTNPGRGGGELRWGRFYSLDFHPRSPLVGMLHATIVLQIYTDGSAQVGGWLGVMPGTRIEADLAELRQVTDDWFAAHGKDPALYRRLICKGTDDTVTRWRRRPACVGASFYGPPVYPASVTESYAFIEGLFERFVDRYLDIVERRADEAWTAADLAAQDEMRRRWLTDQLFSDPFASKIVPFEAWSFANMPPVVKF